MKHLCIKKLTKRLSWWSLLSFLFPLIYIISELLIFEIGFLSRYAFFGPSPCFPKNYTQKTTQVLLSFITYPCVPKTYPSAIIIFLKGFKYWKGKEKILITCQNLCITVMFASNHIASEHCTPTRLPASLPPFFLFLQYSTAPLPLPRLPDWNVLHVLLPLLVHLLFFFLWLWFKHCVGGLTLRSIRIPGHSNVPQIFIGPQKFTSQIYIPQHSCQSGFSDTRTSLREWGSGGAHTFGVTKFWHAKSKKNPTLTLRINIHSCI